MKSWFEPLWVALSAYSTLPVPQRAWTEGSMRWAICFFPAAGLLCGAALLVWYRLCGALGAGEELFAAAAVCLPLLATGGIHMDGYMDVVDALSSHQSREKKLEIMKDPRCGAFAVMFCGAYLLLSFGLYAQLYEAGGILVLCPGFVLSRALSALCAVTMPSARREGMLCAFTRHAQKRGAAAAAIGAAALAGAGMIWIAPVPGAAALGLSLAWMAGYRAMAGREFGGATGDTAGFFLQLCELAILIGAWIGGLRG